MYVYVYMYIYIYIYIYIYNMVLCCFPRLSLARPGSPWLWLSLAHSGCLSLALLGSLWPWISRGGLEARGRYII